MKRLLPISVSSLRSTVYGSRKSEVGSQPERGFTLVELLVVVAIIAILAVMGFAVFSGLTGRGNDAKRNADMKAFADAMEIKRANNTDPSVYITVVATDFAGGTFPAEPTTRTIKYCYKDNTTAAIGNATLNDFGIGGTELACPGGWANVSGVAPTVTTNAKYFKFCTANDAKTSIICQGNRQ